MTAPYDIVIIGLTVTSSWGNGHASTWRSLMQGLSQRGHSILFLERDMPWYAENRDEPNPAGATTVLYGSLDELESYRETVNQASLVIVGSYVPDGVKVGEWAIATSGGACAFYDIDTPITLAKLAAGDNEYISADLIPKYDAYLSFTGGRTLRRLEEQYGSPMARELYCSVDQQLYSPVSGKIRWDLGYLGTYSDDRQPALNNLLMQPACEWPSGNFAVAGPLYPESIAWPENVERFQHLAPAQHPSFYGAQSFTLNITREAMRAAGYSPSVRLFEAAACGVPIISDWWDGLDSIFEIGREVLVAETGEDTLRYLRDIPLEGRLEIGYAARKRVLAEHTPAARASQVEEYLKEMNDNISADPARRHRRSRKLSSGLATGMASQSNGKAAGESALAIAEANQD